MPRRSRWSRSRPRSCATGRRPVRMNLLDDSLSVDRAEAGKLTAGDGQPLPGPHALRAAPAAAASCSPAPPSARPSSGRARGRPARRSSRTRRCSSRRWPPAARRTLQAGLLATFQASIPSMAEELRGDGAAARHRRSTCAACSCRRRWTTWRGPRRRPPPQDRRRRAPAAGCDAVMLAQFSMAAARHRAEGAALPGPEQPRLRRARPATTIVNA
jgi:hypothetical protein